MTLDELRRAVGNLTIDRQCPVDVYGEAQFELARVGCQECNTAAAKCEKCGSKIEGRYWATVSRGELVSLEQIGGRIVLKFKQ